MLLSSNFVWSGLWLQQFHLDVTVVAAAVFDAKVKLTFCVVRCLLTHTQTQMERERERNVVGSTLQPDILVSFHVNSNETLLKNENPFGLLGYLCTVRWECFKLSRTV